MSGFEMHRFRTIDRDFTPTERKEIDSWSSRFSPTSNSATFIYHYGSFKKNVNQVFPKYFDAMLYVDSWGTKQVMFRFPQNLVKWTDLTMFTNIYGETYLDFRKAGDYIIMDLCWHNEEGGEWIEEEDYILDPLLPLREEILNGDYRSLYLGWLMVEEKKRVNWEEDEYEEEDDKEDDLPPVPANLKRQNATHQYLMQIFEMDTMLVEAATIASPENLKQELDYPSLILQLSDEEKNSFLLQFLKREARTEIKLHKRLAALDGKNANRVFGESLKWEELYEIAQQKAEEALEIQRQAEQKAHYQKMKKLQSEQAALWSSVEKNLALKNSRGYDKVANILADLRDLAIFEDKLISFEQHLDDVLESYRRSGALLRRLRDKGIIRVVT